MIRLMICLLFCAAAVNAQEYTTDAFGILPTADIGLRENWAGLRQSDDGQQSLQTADEPDATIVFVGPKSIVAGVEPGHAVAIGLDRYGNMVDGAATQFVLGFGGPATTRTTQGIADLLFTPPPKAGSFLAGATIGAIQSARADYRVTANLATVTPRFVQPDGAQLPETFGVITTAPLTDTYGNTVDDGVGLSTILKDSDGTLSFLPSVVRDATGQSTLLSRDIAGRITGRMSLSGTTADGLAFDISALDVSADSAIVMWEAPTIAAVNLRLGPLSTSSGFLVPDGISGVVQVTASDGHNNVAQGWVLDGYLSFVVPFSAQLAPFDVTLSLAGQTLQRVVDLSPQPQNLSIRGAE